MRSVKLLLFGWLIVVTCGAQNSTVPLLERTVNIDVTNQPIAEVLVIISTKTGVKFSYSPTQIPVNKLVTIRVNHKPLRIVLKQVLGDAVQYKTRNNFIILTSKPIEKNKPEPEVVVNGYVYNQQGEGVAYASILNVATHRVAVTNQYGYFKLVLPVTKPTTINVKKANYADTSLVILTKQTQIEVVLKPQKTIVVAKQKDTVLVAHIALDTIKPIAVVNVSNDSVASRIDLIKSWFLSNETKANMRNIGDTLFSKVQFSVIPQLSTSKLLVGNTVNEVSISALVGYAKGINTFAIAGLVNAVEGKAKYVLASGLVNVVEDSVEGFEAAGIANINDGTMNGVQAAGIININDEKVVGVQTAGITNIAANGIDGVQAAGIINITEGNINGTQVAGIINVTEGNIKGMQAAGIINITEGSVAGTQVAGIGNITKADTVGTQIAGIINATEGSVVGTQIAGIANITSKNICGVQISSILNVADNINGCQIGLLNFSNEINGVPIGLFSWSKKGYHKLEFFADETMYTQFAFRTGATKFHNLFIGGIDLTNNLNGLWNFGYGIGSFYELGKNWLWGAELSSLLYLTNSLTTDAVSLYGAHIQFEKQFTKAFSLAFGPTFKLMYNRNQSNKIADAITPYSFYNHTYANGDNIRTWVGAKISLKFF